MWKSLFTVLKKICLSRNFKYVSIILIKQNCISTDNLLILFTIIRNGEVSKNALD